MKFSLGKFLLEVCAVIGLLVIVSAGALAWRLSEGPLDLDFLRPQVEMALADARGGRKVTLDGLALEWSRDRRRAEATLRGITAYDEDGEIQVEAARGAVAFDAVSLFKGKARVKSIRLEDGSTNIYRNSDGVWSYGQEAPLDQIRIEEKGTLDLAAWRDLLPPLREAIGVNTFERVEFSGFDIEIHDAVAGLRWGARDTLGQWLASTDGIMIDVSADLEGEDAPEAIQLTFYTDPGVEEFSFEVGIVGADPERIASLLTARDLPFRYEGGSDIVFGGEASEVDGLRRLQFSAASENGVFTRDEQRYDIAAIGFELLYDVTSRKLDLTSLHLETDRLSGEYKGWAELGSYIGENAENTEDAGAPFFLSGTDINLDVTPVFEREWNIEAVDVGGVFFPQEKAVDIQRAIARIGTLNGTANGRMWLEERPIPADEAKPAGAKDQAGTEETPPPETRLKFAARLNAQAEGRVSKREVLDFWPVNLGAMSRGWVDDHVLEGTATRLDFKMDLRPEVYERGYLNNDSLELVFEVEGAKVSFLDDVPPVSGASGVGTLRGNSMTIDVKKGELGGWIMDDGSIDLPRFHPEGETAVLKTTGRGDLKSLMTILENSSLKTASEAGIEIDPLKGFGGMDATITWPMQSVIEDTDIGFEVEGGFIDASVPGLAGGFGLIDSDVDVEVDNDGLILRGQGRFGPAPTEFSWVETFSKVEGEDGHSRLEATAVVSPDFLNAFNLAARNILAGEIEVQLSAQGQGRDFEAIDARLDLTRAAIDLSEVGWIKRVNEPASGVLRYARDADGRTTTSGDIKSDGLELTGEVFMRPDNGLERATIERIYSRDRMDLRGSLLKDTQGRYTVDVSGPLLNASGWIDGLLDFGASASASGRPASGPDAGVSIAVDDLILREDASLKNAQIVLEAEQGEVIKALVAGSITDSKGLEATMETDEDQRVVSLRADDAGWVIRVLTKTDYLLGGIMNLTGRFGKDVGSAELRLNDVRLKNAPLLAQVFSLASLQGLTDVLSGEGVLFSEINAPLRFREGRVDFLGARASGPALGLTLRGWMGLSSGELGLDGVVVPSFGVNSALGGIPIIGDLFVSRQGEGVFAVVYSVSGNLERARVAINPLSAVTPGFLRRIMENPSRPPPEFDDNLQDAVPEDVGSVE
ncbi:MAG: DUF3971 domain-containing protein [Hirschia sp.]|nr:DUF3971 domain-containing protein [Hirschia sp.]